jgi:hypothetical protein
VAQASQPTIERLALERYNCKGLPIRLTQRRAFLQLGHSRAVDMLGPGCTMFARELYMQIAASEGPGPKGGPESSLVASAHLALAAAARNHSTVYQPTAVVSAR